MKNIPNKVIFSIVLLVAVGLLVVFLSKRETSTELTNYRVARETLVQKVSIAGTVTPKRRTLVTAPYDGYVKQLYVSVGQEVNANQPLVSITQSLASLEPVFPLRAPYKGTVMLIQKREGENVKLSDVNEYILRIDDLSSLYVEALSPEFDRLKLKKDQAAIVKASAILDRTFKGVIRDMTLAPKEVQGSNLQQYPVRIELQERDSRLNPGMSVVVDVITATKENVIALPHEYVSRDSKDQYFVTLASGVRKDVSLGLQTEDKFEILSGLDEGESIKPVDFLGSETP